jgi:hypothetical protein
MRYPIGSDRLAPLNNFKILAEFLNGVNFLDNKGNSRSEKVNFII